MNNSQASFVWFRKKKFKKQKIEIKYRRIYSIYMVEYKCGPFIWEMMIMVMKNYEKLKQQ